MPQKNNKKQLWILVGGNGAGKSTFYRLYLKPLGIPFVNADLIAREIAPDNPEKASYRASQIGERMRYELLREGASFCFETVFSHTSKVDFLAHAKAFGYEIICVFIHLNNLGLNKARVHQRVAEGGHRVPDNKIGPRIIRTLHNVSAAIPLCTQVRLLDNSSYQNPFQQVAVIKNNKIEWFQDPPPAWATSLTNKT